MSMIPIHVIAFFLAMLSLPEDVDQFSIKMQGKTIQWTRQNVEWYAMELPNRNIGTYSATSNTVTVSINGKEQKFSMQKFLVVPSVANIHTLNEIPTANTSFGTPVLINVNKKTVTLAQKNGSLFRTPATITWQPPKTTKARTKASTLDIPAEQEAKQVIECLENAFNTLDIEKFQNLLVTNEENEEWIDDILDIKQEKGMVSAKLDITNVHEKEQYLVVETRTTFIVNGKAETKNAHMLFYFTRTSEGLKLEKTEYPEMERRNRLFSATGQLGRRLATAANNKDFAVIASTFQLTEDVAEKISAGNSSAFKQLQIEWLYDAINDPSLTLVGGIAEQGKQDTVIARIKIVGPKGQVVRLQSLTSKWYINPESKQEECRFSP